MIKRLLLTLAALVIIFGGIFGWKLYQFKQFQAMMSQPRPPATIASATAESEQWQPTLDSVGSLVAAQGVFVNNEVAGNVSRILFESGQEVDAGETLVQLEDSSDRAELQGLVAEQHLADLQFQRTRTLLNKHTVSRADYDDARAKLESAQARVVAKEALIKKKTIRAPFSGKLGIRQVNLGQYLAPGSQIVLLQQVDPIYADYSLPERYYDQVSADQEIELTVEAYPDRRLLREDHRPGPGHRPRHTQRSCDGRSSRIPAAACAPACSHTSRRCCRSARMSHRAAHGRHLQPLRRRRLRDLKGRADGRAAPHHPRPATSRGERVEVVKVWRPVNGWSLPAPSSCATASRYRSTTPCSSRAGPTPRSNEHRPVHQSAGPGDRRQPADPGDRPALDLRTWICASTPRPRTRW